MSDAIRVQTWLSERREEMAAWLSALALKETPSTDPTTLPPAFALLADALDEVGFRSLLVPGATSGGLLLARPRQRVRGAPYQLVLGHMDTVWPVGTLATMPVTRDGDRLSGPGVYDMKGGLTQLVFALRALEALGRRPTVTPVVLVNADEEVGSHDSERHIVRLAKGADRAFVLEPSLGPDGRLKTGRKGLGRFTLTVIGKAAHAGLDPTAGASAILELSHQIQKLFALNDPARGVSVNVGTIDGGLRPNVVAPISTAVIDVRVPDMADAGRIEAAIHGLQPVTPGTRLEVEGRIGRPPMRRSAALWDLARGRAEELGVTLNEATAGGGSDGNTTSQYTPTLDGLGPVGDGAHAAHEHLTLDRLVERAALLALLLDAPPLENP